MLSIPLWVVLVLACMIGWIICQLCIPGPKTGGDYSWDFFPALAGMANTILWLAICVLALIVSLLFS